ncbi:P-II family nitrogen regulator [Salinisphaera sp. USBA-960]|nr:P-II family nitrogen regulator [Salifodinibacter halophilus]NNC27220.1 P-II family nitrogen regulator [Salifodinibacter halophilus]
MQEIKAYVREHMLDHVIDALAAVPELPGIAVVHLREFGHATEDGRLVKIDMAKLEIDVPDSLAESVVQTIAEHARTGDGHSGDGKVFVSELREAVRIADGACGDVAVRR